MDKCLLCYLSCPVVRMLAHMFSPSTLYLECSNKMLLTTHSLANVNILAAHVALLEGTTNECMNVCVLPYGADSRAKKNRAQCETKVARQAEEDAVVCAEY